MYQLHNSVNILANPCCGYGEKRGCNCNGTPANVQARMSQDQFVPSLEWSVRSSPRSAWPVLTFNAAVRIDTVEDGCGVAIRFLPAV
jgi:hypothetical protein